MQFNYPVPWAKNKSLASYALLFIGIQSRYDKVGHANPVHIVFEEYN
jgi:hypothetical protein